MAKPTLINYETVVCAELLQPLVNLCYDGFGYQDIPDPITPADLRTALGVPTQAEMDAAEGRLDTLESTTLTQQGEIDGAEADISTLQTDVGALQTDVGTLQTDVGDRVLKAGDTMTGQLSLPTPEGDSNPTLLSQFASDLAVPGYLRFPGGIIQWGQVTTAGDPATATVVFPIPMAAALTVMLTPISSGSPSCSVSSASGTQMTVWTRAADGTNATHLVQWTVIGRDA